MADTTKSTGGNNMWAQLGAAAITGFGSWLSGRNQQKAQQEAARQQLAFEQARNPTMEQQNAAFANLMGYMPDPLETMEQARQASRDQLGEMLFGNEMQFNKPRAATGAALSAAGGGGLAAYAANRQLGADQAMANQMARTQYGAQVVPGMFQALQSAQMNNLNLAMSGGASGFGLPGTAGANLGNNLFNIG